jgi:hypothetical protein
MKPPLKLYLLRRADDDETYGYDEAHGFVVAARSPHTARKLAAQKHGDEGETTWLRPEYSTCTEIGDTKERIRVPHVVLRDFLAG